jgi:hypothetical protein
MSDLTETLADIRTGHFHLNRSETFDAPNGWCNCGNMWPCDATKLLAAVEAVVALHTVDDGYYGGQVCEMCDFERFPCPTIRALNTALGVDDE